MAYDVTFRKKVVEFHKEGHSLRKTAKIFKIGFTTLKVWKKEIDENGVPQAKYVLKASKTKKLPKEELLKYVKEHPDSYLHEIGEHFGCSVEAVRKAFKKLGITRKKRQRSTANVARKNDESS